MLELFWLLLPVAALSGWWIGRRERPGQDSRPSGPMSSGYLKGLNYLLNEQQDKAIEVFTRMVEVDGDTAELHFALGSLFRRRGEVDRAIRIHQNLIARPAMDRGQRAQALLELGQDYMKAGLLDRAEALFEQVIEANAYVVSALRQLLLIHQQEKDWDSAIAVARRLEGRQVPGMRPLIAQFQCELAEQALQSGDQRRASQLLKRALGDDPNCVRASILQGRLEQARGNDRAALKAYMRVEEQDPEFLQEVLEPLRSCYVRLRQTEALLDHLERLAGERPSDAVSLALADVLHEHRGTQAAADYLIGVLRQAPSVPVLARAARLMAERLTGAARADVEILQGALSELVSRRSSYTCRQCGFSGRVLYWQCPSCRSWGAVKPTLI